MTKSTAICLCLASFAPILILSSTGLFALPRKSVPAKRTLPTAAALNVTLAPYFAKGDGRTDSTAAINQALVDAAACVPPKAVYAPAGTFAHSGVLHVRGAVLSGTGAGTVFQATNPAEGSVEISGTGSGLQNCTLVSPDAKERLNNSHSAGISVNGATRFTISGVTIGAERVTGAASAGILCADRPSAQGIITGNKIYSTLADGIHLTAGAKNITVSENTLMNTGDDMIAVVSYRKDGRVVSGVQITGNQCVRQTHGRGISVVGGEDVRIERNTIQSSDAAGIYLASEDSYDTYAPSQVRVVGNAIRNANQNHAITHGGIYVFGRAAPEHEAAAAYRAQDITISGNTLINTYYMGIRIGGHAASVRVTGNHVSGTTAEGIAISDTGDRAVGAGARDVFVSGNTVEATQAGAVKVFSSMQGALTLTANRFSNINTSNRPDVDVIFIDAQAVAVHPLTVIGNSYQSAGGHPVHSFINCRISAAAAGTSASAIQNGNSTTVVPTLPILIVP